MAIDPNTGIDPNTPSGGGGLLTPKPQTPTADNVNNLVASDSDYMKQAKAAGADYANSRGVLNSSIGAGASQKAAYDAAVPIAAADANIASSEKLAADQNKTTLTVANLSAKTQTDVAQMNIDASAKQQAAEILNQQQLASLSAKTQTDVANLQAETQKAIAAMNISDADKQQLLSIAAQQRLADTQQSTQLQIANMNVSSNQQDKAAAAAVSYATVYSSMVNAINGNTSIPADARASLLENAKTLYSNGMSLVEQTYNVSLDWGQNPAEPAPGASTPAAPAAPADQPSYQPQGGYDQYGNFDGSSPYDSNGNFVG